MSARWLSLCCLSAMLGAFATTGSARAEECGEGDSCPKGFMCETYEVGCASDQPACAPEDADCKAIEPAPCDQAEIKECVPAKCESDTDCGDGMVCHEETIEQCSGGTSAGGASDCPDTEKECNDVTPAPAEEPECTKETTKTCTPKYALPCETADSCGEGFDCVQPEYCVCNAGGSTGSGGAAGTGGSAGGSEPSEGGGSDADAKELPAPAFDAGVAPNDGGSSETSCECKPGDGPKQCEAQEIPCETNAECPDSWTCEEYGGDAVCSGGVARPTIDIAGDAGPSPEGDAGAGFECETQEVEHRCMPPYGDYYGRAAADSNGLGGGIAKGENAPTAQGPEEDDGSELAGGNSADAGAGGEEEEKGLCSVSRVGTESQPGAAALLLGLVGLVLASRRRARR